MWKLGFLITALALSASPLDASPRQDNREASELKRDVERIAAEIYPRRPERSGSRAGSFAASGAAKKR